MLSESELSQTITRASVELIASEMLVVVNLQWSRIWLDIHFLPYGEVADHFGHINIGFFADYGDGVHRKN
jgi:hypothetical protein